jgi:hypothetical protein
MFKNAIIVVAGLAALPQAFATIFITAPIATTTCQGGQMCTVTWKEDDARTAPLLADWGAASVGVYAGSVQQQTLLQEIQPSVNVAQNAAIQFTVNPAIGPNSNQYFIRFQSASVRDPANPTFPLQAFSAKFTLAGMSGQFNATVQAQISAGNTTPGAPSTPAVSSTASRTTAASATTTPATRSSGTSSSATSTQSGAASNVKMGAMTVVGVAGAFLAML